MTLQEPRFSGEEAERANRVWGANCGPGALAVTLGMTLEEVRPFLGEFERRGYMSPTMMFDALKAAKRTWRVVKPADWVRRGLVRVQWEGPWTAPGANPRWAYGHTHWVASAIDVRAGVCVFDINGGWYRLAEWESELVPLLTAQHKRATGKWFITHSIEVEG